MSRTPSGKDRWISSRIRWEDDCKRGFQTVGGIVVKENVKRLGGRSDWRFIALDRERWGLGCETGWSRGPL